MAIFIAYGDANAAETETLTRLTEGLPETWYVVGNPTLKPPRHVPRVHPKEMDAVVVSGMDQGPHL